MPQVLRRFHATFPNVAIEIGNSMDLQQDLVGKRFDVIISGAVSPAETLASVPLFKDLLVCILPEEHPLTHCEYIQYNDFAGNNLFSHADKERNRFKPFAGVGQNALSAFR